MNDKAKNIIEIIRAAVRPYLTFTFTTLFLFIVWKVVGKYMTQEIGTTIISTFRDTLVLIIGIWIGNRNSQNSGAIKPPSA